MPADPKRVKEIFIAVADAPANERTGLLARECGDDSQLRQRVEALLQVHDDSSSFLANQPPSELTGDFTPDPNGEARTIPPRGAATANAPDYEPGMVIAERYTLIERIGEGGMGEVWVAKQTEPVKRKVALKLIKAGMDSKAVLQRFEQERQALALMDHPNIARVLDGGLTPTRQPFFVMELVNGLPSTKFCDKSKLTPRERLELFVPICQAVQHAHQKGIVHRDLKPANILVTLIDGKPVPKVIDFGVAKATGGKLIDESMDTQFGAVVGTLEYMSPEQAGHSSDDIDTRADIYSLGVILYELLTGLRPFDSKRLQSAAIFEMIRVILEEEPSRPSTRLSTDEALPSLAAVRRTEPRRLTSMMRGDLDWIVMKCLEKDRSRRYETANGLARDIQRYLSDEPVEACPPSATYRLRKFARKNRAALTTAAIIAFLLVTGAGISIWQAVRATHAEQSERVARHQAEKAAVAEKQAKEQAQRRLAQIEKGNEIITSIFTDLDIRKVKEGNEPLEAVLAQRLVKAAGQLEGEAIGDPLVVASLQNRLAESLFNLGHRQEALPLIIKSRETRMAKLGADHPETLESMNNLAVCYGVEGRLDLALPLIQESLNSRKTKLGIDHPETLESMNNLAECYRNIGKLDLALPLLEETLNRRKAKLGVDHAATFQSMNNLATLYQALGKRDLALPLLEETFKLTKAKFGAEHPDTFFSMTALATVYQETGKLDLAVPLLEESLKHSKAKLGTDHPETLRTMHHLAAGYHNSDKLDLAVPLYEECLKLRKAKLGPDHPETFETMNCLARCNLATGRSEVTLTLLEEALARQKAKLGPDHPATLMCMGNLAEGYLAAGQPVKALKLLEESLAKEKARLGPEHRETLGSMNNLAVIYSAVGQPAKAVPLLEETLAKMKASDHPETLTCMVNLSAAYREAGQLTKAAPLAEEALTHLMAKFGPDHFFTLGAMHNLAMTYRDSGKLDKALPLLKETLAKRKAKLGPDHRDTIISMNNLAVAYQAAGKVELALPLREETLNACKAKFGPDHPNTLSNMNELAVAYWSMKQLDKSIPLFEETLKRLEKKFGRDHPETMNTAANLGVNYRDAGRLNEALPLFEEGHRAAKKHPTLRWVTNELLNAYVQAGENAKFLTLLQDQLNAARTSLPKDSPQLAAQLALGGFSLIQIKAFTEAETLLRESLDIREKTQPDEWTTFNTKSLLGGALLGQQKYADAEPVLLAGYEGMKLREKSIPPQGSTRIPEALDRLIELYTAINKSDEVKKWQAERAKYPEVKKEPKKK